MEPSSLQTWAQYREINESPSNQQIQHSRFIEIPFASKVQLNDVVSTTSPEFESTNDLTNNGHGEKEGEIHCCIEKETYEALELRCRQLQEDVDVLASHMATQERTSKRERTEAVDEHLALLTKNAALERELDGLREENDVLLRQSARMAAQRTEDEQQADDAREAQDELLRALSEQQQQTEQFQTAAVCASQEREEMRETLDTVQMHCCRLEEELASAHAQALHLQHERDTLQAVVEATVTGAAGFETHQMQAQDELIASLRADLVQMEFELKTVLADKVTLEEKLQLQAAVSQSESYDGVSLGDNASDVVAKRKGPKKRTTIRPVKASKDATNRRGSDLFNNLMDLPNAVPEARKCANATIWLSPSTSSYQSSMKRQTDQDLRLGRSFRDRMAPPSGLTSFVAKTVQSARKHLATPLQNPFGSS